MTHRELFQHYLAKTSPAPLALEVELAQGVYLYGPDGQRWMDLISGISVSAVGHRHPHLLAAIEAQLGRYLHTMVYGELIQAPQVALAKALAGTLSTMQAPQVYFVSSGGEAIEGALKLAKRYTGRWQVVSFQGAYHGSTHGALSAMGDEELKARYRPLLPGFTQLPFGDERALDRIGCRTAAVLIEPVQGEAGVRQAPRAFWQALADRCRQMNTLLIVDEIQSGYGRTGPFWAHQSPDIDIEPDLVVTAKGMGGGLPLGAFIGPSEIMSALTDRPVLGHISTFGGNPVCCAAGLAALQIITRPETRPNVEHIAQIFREKITQVGIGELRQVGLLMALELSDSAWALRAVSKAIELGLLTDWFLFCPTALRIAPPLTTTPDEAADAADRLIEAVKSTAP